MNHEVFEALLEKRLALTRRILASKNAEYANDSDKLHNFKRAAAMLGCSKEKALVGMWTKHIISILDIVEKIENYGEYPDTKLLEEKIGDSVNYLILLEACVKEVTEGNPFEE